MNGGKECGSCVRRAALLARRCCLRGCGRRQRQPDPLPSSSSRCPFARALFVWFYSATLSSVLLMAISLASFDGAINQLSYDSVSASNKVRFLIFSVVIMLAATALIIATKCKLGRAKEAVDIHAGVSDANP
jgi:uncharacterized protein YhhL (DUF1145 family)